MKAFSIVSYFFLGFPFLPESSFFVSPFFAEPFSPSVTLSFPNLSYCVLTNQGGRQREMKKPRDRERELNFPFFSFPFFRRCFHKWWPAMAHCHVTLPYLVILAFNVTDEWVSFVALLPLCINHGVPDFRAMSFLR